ncbi:hypothetical protein E3J95_00730, partial [Candidatus Aerophobetes bacterium]
MAEKKLALPVVKLTRPVFEFDKDCIDPIAQLVLLEALEYCVETSGRRLESLGKIFPKVEASGLNALAAIEAIKMEIGTTPVCKIEGEEPLGKVVAPPPAKPPEAPTTTEIKEKKPRTVPEEWGENIIFKGKKFEGNLTELAKGEGLKIKGADHMIHVFTRAGYTVSGNGEPRKGGRITIAKVGPTPLKYKEEYPPELTVPPKKEKPPIREEKPRKFFDWNILSDSEKRQIVKEADLPEAVAKMTWKEIKEQEEKGGFDRAILSRKAVNLGLGIRTVMPPTPIGALMTKDIWHALPVSSRVDFAIFRNLPGAA